jgi:hypothetical protein
MRSRWSVADTSHSRNPSLAFRFLALGFALKSSNHISVLSTRVYPNPPSASSHGKMSPPLRKICTVVCLFPAPPSPPHRHILELSVFYWFLCPIMNAIYDSMIKTCRTRCCIGHSHLQVGRQLYVFDHPTVLLSS